MDQKNYSDEAAIEGHIFTKMMQGLNNLERADKIYKNIKVLSRSRPEDKYNMVVELQKANHIVAVIGDGTNDAPALKKANLGIAMGIAGTQEAQDASDIILLDDNFTSFTKGIMWGRNIYDTIQKYLQFNLTMNYVVLGIMLLTCAIIKQEVFKPIQIFWVKI